ncbi:iron-sulfur cluster co-chaperone protein HscB homolog isoform X1 [Punica granatum]|uniref:Iron-sulfur cluster co-chaperone protein HscB homolog isoform X1 n=1 Tax=Punica granatum TaxID=22663 RepID=A0A6P8DFU9_PUNGR|nr:iron-sulfur cluster co-chaperone protein HscB homolog isoform X1 [Punica granatum]
MWKRKLLSPISTALRRRSLPAPASHLPIHSSSQLGSSRLSSRREIRRPSGSERCYLLENLHLASRSYCSQPAEDSAARCWNCGSAAQSSPFLACNSCRSVQPVDSSVDYFQIFGLEKKYEIDGINLEGKYKDWQKKLHPDLVHTKSEREKEYAAEQSARVIDAYRTLSNPLPRAIYVLKLEGVNVDEEETVSEPELLTEILEIREAVEEAADSQALNQIRSQMEEKLKHWSKSFANAIHCGKLEDALVCVRRMKYYTRVNEQITKKL